MAPKMTRKGPGVAIFRPVFKYLHQNTVEVAASHAAGCQVAIGNSDSDHGKNEDNGTGDVIEPNGAAPHAAGNQGQATDGMGHDCSKYEENGTDDEIASSCAAPHAAGYHGQAIDCKGHECSIYEENGDDDKIGSRSAAPPRGWISRIK